MAYTVIVWFITCHSVNLLSSIFSLRLVHLLIHFLTFLFGTQKGPIMHALVLFLPRRFHSILCAFIEEDYVCACDYVCIWVLCATQFFGNWQKPNVVPPVRLMEINNDAFFFLCCCVFPFMYLLTTFCFHQLYISTSYTRCTDNAIENCRTQEKKVLYFTVLGLAVYINTWYNSIPWIKSYHSFVF